MVKNYNQFVNEAAVSYDAFDTEACKNAIAKKLEIPPVEITVEKNNTFTETVRVTLNYNKPEDYINKLEVNAHKFIFEYWFYAGRLESAHSYFMIRLSPYDKTHDHKYMAMRSAEDLGIECGIKSFRRTKVKSEQDIADKICKYINQIMPIVQTYTGGYPYHDGILEVSILDAYKK